MTMTKGGYTIFKVGTGVLTDSKTGKLNRAALVHLVTSLARIVDAGENVLLVSSGAVGSGVSEYGLCEYPTDRETKQACAAVGQAKIIRKYSNLFATFGISVAQVLLTARDLSTPDRRSCMKKTLTKMLCHPRVIPILNENDCVTPEETRFGDNDTLSAHVARLVGAKRVILMTSVDGLLNASGELIEDVPDIETAFGHVRSSELDGSKFSVGGMHAKLSAIKLAVDAGIDTYIINGSHPERLCDIVIDHKPTIATHFRASKIAPSQC